MKKALLSFGILLFLAPAAQALPAGELRAHLLTYHDTMAEDPELELFGDVSMQCSNGTLNLNFNLQGNNGQNYQLLSRGQCSETSVSFALDVPILKDGRVVFVTANYTDDKFTAPGNGRVWAEYGKTPGGPPYDRAILTLMEAQGDTFGACLSGREVQRIMTSYRSREIPFQVSASEIANGQWDSARRRFEFRSKGAMMGCRYDVKLFLSCDQKVSRRKVSIDCW